MKNNRIHLGKKSSLRIIVPTVLAVALLAVAGWITLSQQGQTYWVVDVDAPSGANLANLPLSKIRANFAPATNRYLKTDEPPTGYLSKPMQAGELINLSEVSQVLPGTQSQVVVTSSSTLAASIQPSSSIEVWVASRFGNEFGPAALLIEAATVVKKLDADSVFKQQAPQVELQIPNELLPALLDAMANQSAIYLVASS